MFETEKVIEQEVYEDVTPNPEFLIKSIAEQGYTLETALADLIDNSITAKCDKIDIHSTLIGKSNRIRMFIADNGDGMTEEELTKNLKFPSSSIDESRDKNDLGRFGLGLKTASFSQSRKFTVLSRKKRTKKFCGRTWDVDLLKQGQWIIIKESDKSIQDLITSYKDYFSKRLDRTKQFSQFDPNTIVIWDGMFRFDEYYSKDTITHLETELTKRTVDYLGTVFHKFIQNDKIKLTIRINNDIVDPFDPFSSNKSTKKMQPMPPHLMPYRDGFLKMQGFILPVEALKDERSWTTKSKSLTDLEGVYIYREDRLIFFGGWNGLFRGGGKNKLARLNIQVGNKYDNLLQLNVAKSKITIPFELMEGVVDYCKDVRSKAVLELSRRGLKKKASNGTKTNKVLLEKVFTSNNGVIYKINKEYSVLKLLEKSLNQDQSVYLKTLLVSINSLINDQKSVNNDSVSVLEQANTPDISSLINGVQQLKEEGMSKSDIIDLFLSKWGYSEADVPEEINNVLKD